ncbi:cytochrome P450 [Chloracidobacterium thermophilum]|uniref:cytochrome P450 n=1 Tax=Chloracidobacterium thermophilum TaxID=458033 RepID=UPI000738548E|nr:cytochrome P450 [Chloracidobacterium thermophilum]
MIAQLEAPRAARTLPGANIYRFRTDALRLLQGMYRRYGDIVQFRLGSERVFMVSNPDYIREILITNHKNFIKGRGLQRARKFLGNGLLTSEGEFHKRQRRLSQPAFHRERIALYARIMAQYAAEMRDEWQPGEQHDMAREMMRLTLRVVAKTLFDAEVKSEMDEIGAALTTTIELFSAVMTLPFFELIEKLPLPFNYRFRAARARLDETVYRIIEERRRTSEDRGDLLSMLLIAQDEEGDGTGMTDEQLRDEAMTIFLAGHETTANALTWTWYLLSQHPEVEACLHAEVDAVLGGRLPTAADYGKLKYTEMVFAESMRLYPPAWVFGRRALEAFSLGNYRLPARALILMSPYVVQRRSDFYPAPERFIPERWTPEEKEKRPKFSYFPFGGGPRACIGEGFAWMEGVLILATLAQKWRLRLAPEARVVPEPLITLRPKYGMPMILEARA